MQLAKVIGHATATLKHRSLTGWRLLVVRVLDARGEPEGDPLIVVDGLGSRRGDRVILTSDGTSVREMMRADDTPVRWAVIGVVDRMSGESRVGKHR